MSFANERHHDIYRDQLHAAIYASTPLLLVHLAGLTHFDAPLATILRESPDMWLAHYEKAASVASAVIRSLPPPSDHQQSDPDTEFLRNACLVTRS